MSEIRCPMCGRPNPPDQEVCRHCQARLKPLVVKPFEGEGAPITPGEPPAPGVNFDADSSLPDWLRDLRQKGASGSGSEPEESQTDWQAGEVENASPSSETGMEDSSGWMDRLSRPGEERSPEPERGGAETPIPGSRPDWMAPERSDALAGEEAGGLPDWLSGLEQPTEGRPAPEAAPGGVEKGELPDWLSGLEQPTLGQPAPEAAPGGAEAGEVPDWLSRLAPPETPAEEPAQELPAWFAEEGIGPAKEAPQDQEPAPGGLSEWNPEEQAVPGRTIPLEPEPEAGQPAPLLEEDLPDWLKRLEASASEPRPAAGVPAFTLDEEDGLPLGLEDEFLESGPEEEARPETPALSTLPEWLSQVSQEAEMPEGEAASGEEEAGLAPAQLPTWLEAMRPVEAAAPAAPVGDDLSSQIEKVGPLAGMRGVIPAEPVIGHLRKPPAYSVKLSLTESQNRSAVLLQKLLESEMESRPVPPRAVSASQAVLRLIIAAALLLMVLVPLWSQSQAVPLPDPTALPNGIGEAVELIGGLPAGSLVLLAVDYEPGLSAEMEASAQAVVRALNARGASLVLVSTNPAGPLMAERLMNQAGAGSYVNLGYISGGPAGMLRFAASPGAALPFDLRNDGQPPRSNLWETEPLSRVRTVADFDIAVVLTENPGVAQDWIEQVQPTLSVGQVPLLMAVSAQAEPLVRPYFEGVPRQVNGLIAGLQGGATFEVLTGQAGNARSYWDAFAWGLLVAVALILVGGLIAVLRGLLAPRKGAHAEGPQ